MQGTLVSKIQQQIGKRLRYHRAVAEINSLTDRDLSDMRTTRGEMLRWARQDIFG